MGGEVRIPKKQKKRRGEDPRLDALADELARESAAGGDGRGGRKGAPALVASGGMDEARVHMAGIAPPADVDHATLEMRKVVIGGEDEEEEDDADEDEEGEGEGEGGEEDAGRDRVARRVTARWRMVALAAAVVAVVSVGLFVRSSLRDHTGERDDANAAKESVIEAAPPAQAGAPLGVTAATASVRVTPSGTVPAVSMVDCAPPGVVTAGASEPARPPEIVSAPHAATAVPHASSHGVPSAESAPTAAPASAPAAAPSAVGSAGAPVPDTSSLEF